MAVDTPLENLDVAFELMDRDGSREVDKNEFGDFVQMLNGERWEEGRSSKLINHLFGTSNSLSQVQFFDFVRGLKKDVVALQLLGYKEEEGGGKRLETFIGRDKIEMSSRERRGRSSSLNNTPSSSISSSVWSLSSMLGFGSPTPSPSEEEEQLVEEEEVKSDDTTSLPSISLQNAGRIILSTFSPSAIDLALPRIVGLSGRRWWVGRWRRCSLCWMRREIAF